MTNRRFISGAIALLVIIAVPLMLTSEVWAIDFEAIRDNMNDMTSLEWDEYTNSRKGERVSWTGWIKDVKEEWFGGYEILIDMDLQVPSRCKMWISMICRKVWLLNFIKIKRFISRERQSQ